MSAKIGLIPETSHDVMITLQQQYVSTCALSAINANTDGHELQAFPKASQCKDWRT